MASITKTVFDEGLTWSLWQRVREPIKNFGLAIITLTDTFAIHSIIDEIASRLDEKSAPILIVGPTSPLQLRRAAFNASSLLWVTTTSGRRDESAVSILSPYDLSGIGIFLVETLKSQRKGMKPVIIGDFLDNLLPHVTVEQLSAFVSSLSFHIKMRKCSSVLIVSSQSHEPQKLSILRRYADVVIDITEEEIFGKVERRMKVWDKMKNLQASFTFKEKPRRTHLKKFIFKSRTKIRRVLPHILNSKLAHGIIEASERMWIRATFLSRLLKQRALRLALSLPYSLPRVNGLLRSLHNALRKSYHKVLPLLRTTTQYAIRFENGATRLVKEILSRGLSKPALQPAVKHVRKHVLSPISELTVRVWKRSLIRKVNLVLYVDEFDESLQFYRDILRLRPTYIDETERDWATFDVGGTKLAITLKENNHAVTGEDSTAVIFEVSNLEKALEDLIKNGVQCLGPVQESPFGNYIEFADPSGNTLILIEPTLH